MPWLGASTSARLPTRRISSTPSSVLPDPGGATMCVRRCRCAVLLERRERGPLVRAATRRRTSGHRSGRSQSCEIVRERVVGQPVEREPDALEAARDRRAPCATCARGCPAGAGSRTPSRPAAAARCVPSRKSIRPVIPCLSRKLCARLGVSLAGSTLMPMTFTPGLSTSSSAPRIVCTCAGQVSRQVRVHEREHDGVALQRGAGDRLAVLVGEREVRHRLVGRALRARPSRW